MRDQGKDTNTGTPKYDALEKTASEDADVGIRSLNMTLEVYGPLILIVYLLGGACLFAGFENWEWATSLYFCVVSLSTVGYGDVTPSTNIMKIFTVFYIYFGIAFVASIVGQLVGGAVSKGQSTQSDNSSTEGENVEEEDEVYCYGRLSLNQFELLRALLIVVTLGIIGTTVYTLNEDMSTVDGIYFSMITLASVGYGEISTHKTSTQIFDIFFILIGVSLMALALAKFAEVWARIEQKKQIEKFIAMGVTMEVIEAIDEDKSGEVDRAEFLAYMLVHMGKAEALDVNQINQLFNKMDKDGGGTLDINDIGM